MTENPRPAYRFSARDGRTPTGWIRYQCAFDSAALHSCSRTYRERLTVGRHVLRARAIDAAGNRSAVSSARVTVRPPTSYSLRLSTAGEGQLVVQPGGRQCTASCDLTFPAGTHVTITAAAATGSFADAWSGACTVSGLTCRIAMTGPKSAGVKFSPYRYELAVSVSGSGSVTADGSPIDCPGTCAASLAFGTEVTLRARPAAGWVFAGWSPGCSPGGEQTCTIRITKPVSFAAAFVVAPPSSYDLAITPTGQGAVVLGATRCSTFCSLPLPAGTTVTLQADATEGSYFAGWSGDCTGTAYTCEVRMDRTRAVGATFTPYSFKLTVAVTGAGRVKGAFSPIDCPGACVATFGFGVYVTLHATPDSGLVFTGWGGSCAYLGTNPTCTVGLFGDTTVSAGFAAAGPSALPGASQ